MRMYVCMYVCMCLYVCMCVCVCVCVCVVYACVCVGVDELQLLMHGRGCTRKFGQPNGLRVAAGVRMRVCMRMYVFV